jgi:hypothetical protein
MPSRFGAHNTYRLLKNLPNVFGDDSAVEQVDDAMGIFGVRMRMRDHHDGRAFTVQFREQLTVPLLPYSRGHHS